MGAESFYVKVSVVDIGISKIEFLSKLSELKVRYSSNSASEYELEEFLIMTVHLDCEMVRGLSIEGCFSWFYDCSIEIYKILSLINNHIFTILLNHHDGSSFSFSSKEGYLVYINELYQEKYKDFNIRYGSMNVKCLPRERFYSYIKGQSKKSIFRKLFK